MVEDPNPVRSEKGVQQSRIQIRSEHQDSNQTFFSKFTDQRLKKMNFIRSKSDGIQV